MAESQEHGLQRKTEEAGVWRQGEMKDGVWTLSRLPILLVLGPPATLLPWGVPEDPQHLSTTFPFLLNMDPVLATKTVFTKIQDHLESSEQWILPFGEKMKCRLKRL